MCPEKRQSHHLERPGIEHSRNFNGRRCGGGTVSSEKRRSGIKTVRRGVKKAKMAWEGSGAEEEKRFGLRIECRWHGHLLMLERKKGKRGRIVGSTTRSRSRCHLLKDRATIKGQQA